MIDSKRWLGWGVVVGMPIVAFLATAGFMSIPPNTRGIDIAEGRELFRAHCGSCHFAKVGFPAHHGPNLYDIGRSGAHRRPDHTASQYILESILEPNAYIAPTSRPGMPNNIVSRLAPDEIRDIVGFLCSCGAFPDYKEIVNLSIPDRRQPTNQHLAVTRDQMELAERTLREKGTCLQCHSVYNVPEDRIHAPGLFAVGLVDHQQVRSSIIDPYREIKANYGTVQVALQSGEIITGRLLSRNPQQITLVRRTENGELRSEIISIDTIETVDGQPVIEPSPMSLMPNGFAQSLTAEELDAIIILIQQLN